MIKCLSSEQPEQIVEICCEKKGRGQGEIEKKGLNSVEEDISLLTSRLGAKGWEGVAEAEETTVWSCDQTGHRLFSEMEEHRCVWSTGCEDGTR